MGSRSFLPQMNQAIIRITRHATSSVQGIPSNSPRCMIRQELPKLNTSSKFVLQPSSLPLLHSHINHTSIHPFISFINHSSSIQLLHHSHYNQASQTNPHPHSIQREPLPTTSPFIVTMQLRALLTALWLIIQFETTQALPVDTTTTIVLVRRLVVSFST
jgi:hypothetical protein